MALARPPFVYQDSLVYIELSKGPILRFTALRPNGYPLLLRAVSTGGDDLGRVAVFQHGAALMVGVLAYVLLLRLGVRRWIAVTAVAVVVLEAYTIALGQAVLTEAFFTLFLFASLFLLVVSERRPLHLVTSGLLLAFAALMRPAGLFAVPPWVAYVVLVRTDWRRVVLAVSAVLVPLVAYCGVRSLEGRTFGLTDADGWFLYSMVAPTLDCRGARVPEETRPLCDGPRDEVPDFYMYNRSSPAQILFFGPTGDVNVDRQIGPENNELLRRFAFAVIAAHPLTYARTVLDGFWGYFKPAPRPPELTVYGEPQSLFIRYERLFHMRWWVLSAASGATLAVLFVNRRSRRAPEIVFLAGSAWALLLGSATTTPTQLRYAVPVLPLLVCAAALAVDAAAPTGGGHRNQSVDIAAPRSGLDQPGARA